MDSQQTKRIRLEGQLQKTILSLIEDRVYSLSVENDWKFLCRAKLDHLSKEEKERARRWKQKRLDEKNKNPEVYCQRCIQAGVEVIDPKLQDIYQNILNKMSTPTKSPNRSATKPKLPPASAILMKYRSPDQDGDDDADDGTIEVHTDGAIELSTESKIGGTTKGGVLSPEAYYFHMSHKEIPIKRLSGRIELADWQLPLFIGNLDCHPEMGLVMYGLRFDQFEVVVGKQIKLISGIQLIPNFPVDPRDDNVWQAYIVNDGAAIAVKMPCLFHGKQRRAKAYYYRLTDAAVEIVNNKALKQQQAMNTRIEEKAEKTQTILFKLPPGIKVSNQFFGGLEDGLLKLERGTDKSAWDEAETITFDFSFTCHIVGTEQNLNKVKKEAVCGEKHTATILNALQSMTIEDYALPPITRANDGISLCESLSHPPIENPNLLAAAESETTPPPAATVVSEPKKTPVAPPADAVVDEPKTIPVAAPPAAPKHPSFKNTDIPAMNKNSLLAEAADRRMKKRQEKLAARRSLSECQSDSEVDHDKIMGDPTAHKKRQLGKLERLRASLRKRRAEKKSKQTILESERAKKPVLPETDEEQPVGPDDVVLAGDAWVGGTIETVDLAGKEGADATGGGDDVDIDKEVKQAISLIQGGQGESGSVLLF